MVSLLAWVSERLPVKSVNVRTPSAKVRHWKQVDRRRQGWTRAMAKQAARLFREEGERVVSAFQSASGPMVGQARAMDAVVRGRERWEAFYRVLYLTVGKDFAGSVWRSLGVQKATAVDLEVKGDLEDEWTRMVLSYVNSVGADRVVAVSDTTRAMIRTVVGEGIGQGHTMTEIADAIQERYVGFADYRAERIARTEVVGASNFGGQAAARATGMTLIKEWISTRDERTRGQDPSDDFDHTSVDGQQRRLEEPYDIGGEAMNFPGDGTFGASPGNVINCRCVEAYARPDDLVDPVEPPPVEELPPVEDPSTSEPVSALLDDVASLDELGGGVNLTLLVELENGKQGVWKPASGEPDYELRKYVPPGESYKREAAAWEVAKLVGMDDLVPETRLRTIRGEVGSIQEFRRGMTVAKELDRFDQMGRVSDRERIAVFDFIIGNSDRHAVNWLVDRETEQVTLIDHGLAFPTSDKQFLRSRFVGLMGESAAPINHDLLSLYVMKDREIVDVVRTMVGKEAAAVVELRLERLALAKTWKQAIRDTEGGLYR